MKFKKHYAYAAFLKLNIFCLAKLNKWFTKLDSNLKVQALEFVTIRHRLGTHKTQMVSLEIHFLSLSAFCRFIRGFKYN